MATIDPFNRGEDIYREATLTIDGVAADTANFTEITIIVRQKFSKVVIGTYTFTGGTVTKELPTTDGKVSFIINRADTEDEQTGIYEANIVTQELDADYVGGIRYREVDMDLLNLLA